MLLQVSKALEAEVQACREAQANAAKLKGLLESSLVSPPVIAFDPWKTHSCIFTTSYVRAVSPLLQAQSCLDTSEDADTIQMYQACFSKRA